MHTLQDVFMRELGDIFHAEKQLVKALPKMSRAAVSTELRDALNTHLEETRNQVKRLEEVFHIFGKTPRGKECEGMEGLIEEEEEAIEENEENAARDASLICAAQKVEHYEIASYGCLCAWAKKLNKDEAVKLLEENMGEEKAADKKLSELAESSINLEAAEEAPEEEVEMESE